MDIIADVYTEDVTCRLAISDAGYALSKNAADDFDVLFQAGEMPSTCCKTCHKASKNDRAHTRIGVCACTHLYICIIRAIVHPNAPIDFITRFINKACFHVDIVLFSLELLVNLGLIALGVVGSHDFREGGHLPRSGGGQPSNAKARG